MQNTKFKIFMSWYFFNSALQDLNTFYDVKGSEIKQFRCWEKGILFLAIRRLRLKFRVKDPDQCSSCR